MDSPHLGQDHSQTKSVADREEPHSKLWVNGGWEDEEERGREGRRGRDREGGREGRKEGERELVAKAYVCACLCTCVYPKFTNIQHF